MCLGRGWSWPPPPSPFCPPSPSRRRTRLPCRARITSDAFVRIGHATGAPNGAKPNARQAYLIALTRARAQRSPDGVILVAEAFARLGDHEIAALLGRPQD
jgi:hypothetical protein